MKEIEKLRRDIIAYKPTDDLERVDKKTILSLLDAPNILDREELLYHITSSCWVMNEKRDKVLMIYHNIYNSWSWVGGHNDGNPNSFEVAKKELKEETGICRYIEASGDIFSLEILPVFLHRKREKWVPSHLHLNITYLFIVDESETLVVNKEETSGVKWVSISDLEKVVKEKNMLMVYSKLLNKIYK